MRVRRGRLDRRDLVATSTTPTPTRSSPRRSAGSRSSAARGSGSTTPTTGRADLPERLLAAGLHARAGRGAARRRDRRPGARRAAAGRASSCRRSSTSTASTRSCRCTTRCSARTTPRSASPAARGSRSEPSPVAARGRRRRARRRSPPGGWSSTPAPIRQPVGRRHPARVARPRGVPVAGRPPRGAGGGPRLPLPPGRRLCRQPADPERLGFVELATTTPFTHPGWGRRTGGR